MLDQVGLTRDVLNRARRSRDARFDGKFFIAVKTTRIYCRPICPSRTCKDANVIFYLTAAEAAAAGFRPCRRCRPEAAPGSPAWLGTSAVVQRALRLIQDGALDESSIEELAARLGVGPRHLRRLFTRRVGVSPIAVAQTRRLEFAKQLLDETRLPITEVALASGFNSVRRFNGAFKAVYRCPPREIRRTRGAGNSSASAQTVLQLRYRPPYDWAHLQEFLARRAIAGVESTTPAFYARTVRTASATAMLEVRPLPAADGLELRIQGCPSRDLLSLCSAVRRMFDLAADPARIAAALRACPRLAALVARNPGLRIPGTWDAFESGVRAIIGQQVSVAGARTMLRRLVTRAGEGRAFGRPDLTHVFPTAAALAEADLAGLGITRQRAAALTRFARAVRDGAISFNDSTDAVMAALTALEGIGAWTAGYVALRGLGDPDGFPSGDLILRRHAASARLPLSVEELDAQAESWRPFRAYAALHLWQVQDESRFEVRRRPVFSAIRA